jgi:hypothetical protein
LHGPQKEASQRHLSRLVVRSSYAQPTNPFARPSIDIERVNIREIDARSNGIEEQYVKRTEIIRKTQIKKSEEEVLFKEKIGRILSSQVDVKRDIYVNIEGVMPLLNIRYDEELEKLANVEQTKQVKENRKKVQESNYIKRRFTTNENLRLNRIIPYVNFSEKCNEKMKTFRYSTKSQKNLYQFNQGLIDGTGAGPRLPSTHRISSANYLIKH